MSNRHFLWLYTDETKALQSDSILNVRYGISGDRTTGAHPPVTVGNSATKDEKQDLIFRSALVLQRPVLDPFLAVGFLPLPSSSIRVGELVSMKWRVERLKDFETNEDTPQKVSHKQYKIFLLLMRKFNF